MNYQQRVERWNVFEFSCKGNDDGNPFTDYSIRGIFRSKNEIKKVDGFYDGGGIFRVRFMPSFAEDYEFEISGTFSDEKYNGKFSVTPASKNNHGPVHTAYTYHFAYEDGTPYFSIGTTCYVWALQPEDLQKQTLNTLANSAFNKMRFCVFPKHYIYNFNEPLSYPYTGKPMDSSILTRENFKQYIGAAPGNEWDSKRFNPEYFRHIEFRIKDLQDLGIEADLIVMHPYDRWGFSMMSAEDDDLYWKYVIARFSAYRNVWWSLANEYDLMPQKSIADWERYASIICEKDPYNHLRSIHNWRNYYDYTRPWVTHCSIQRTDMYKCAELVTEWRERYRKPVVLDEIVYEGNIEMGWGSISGRELVRRFWEAACRGGYAGHGETFVHPQNILWWSHGGELHGESPERLAFLYSILCETPGPGLKPVFLGKTDETAAAVDAVPEDPGYYLIYYGFNCYSCREFHFNDENEYRIEVIDTWNMTIEDRGTFRGKFRVDLPGREYMAVRIRRNNNGS
jgi:hypothetical protein